VKAFQYKPISRKSRSIAHELGETQTANGNAVQLLVNRQSVNVTPETYLNSVGNADTPLNQKPADSTSVMQRTITPFTTSAVSSTPVVQRYLTVYKPNFTVEPSPAQQDAIKIGKKIDDQVMSAYREFMKGDYEGASKAQIDLYKLRKSEFDDKKGSMHPSTAAGYVIEGKSNTKIKDAISDVETQVGDMLRGTRPDIAFKIPDNEEEKGMKGLVDITATNSAGHIFLKKGNWTGHKDIPYVAESIYPSIDFNAMDPIELSEEDLQNIKERGVAKSLLKKETWDYWQEKFESAQEMLRISVLSDFNKNNTIPFTGTRRQATKVAKVFALFGINASLTKDSKKITINSLVSFDDKSDPTELDPFKVVDFKADQLYSVLSKGSMTKLLSSSLDTV
jgi:hypothetical protein